LTVKGDGNFCLFYTKGSQKNSQKFETLTGKHSITFNKVIQQSQEFFMILLSGNLKVRLEFSPVTKVDLSLLAIAKFNSVIQLNCKGLVMTSYTSKKGKL
jgi:hypothetical protein